MEKEKIIKKFTPIAGSIYRRRTFIAILLVYGFLWIIYCYFFIYDKQWAITKLYLNTHFADGFAVSLSASLFDDLIIFIVLTYVVILLTTKRLWEYSFNDKVQAIINNKSVKTMIE